MLLTQSNKIDPEIKEEKETALHYIVNTCTNEIFCQEYMPVRNALPTFLCSIRTNSMD